VQHERQSFGGLQAVEHHEQRQPDRVGEQGRVLRVVRVAGADQGLGELGAAQVLASGLT